MNSFIWRKKKFEGNKDENNRAEGTGKKKYTKTSKERKRVVYFFTKGDIKGIMATGKQLQSEHRESLSRRSARLSVSNKIDKTETIMNKNNKNKKTDSEGGVFKKNQLPTRLL